jgi:hypothetical protein
MKSIRFSLFVLLLSLMSFNVQSEINLNIKIEQVIDSKTIETVKTISTNYNQDIVIMQEGLKNKIVINLKKFKNILVNGTKINPIQIDIKMVDASKKTVGKPQTITSFYNNNAEFNVQNSAASDNGDVNVSLNFQEI